MEGEIACMDDFWDGRLKGSWESEKVMKMVVSHASSIQLHLEKRNEVTKTETVESVHTALLHISNELASNAKKVIRIDYMFHVIET